MWATRVRNNPDSLSFCKKQQRHLSYVWENNLERIPKGKEDFFFSSNKLSNKPLIHTVSLPNGNAEYPVQCRLNFKEKLLQLSLLFPSCQSRSRCHLVIYFVATKRKEKKKSKHTFLKGQTLYIHLLQGSIGHQTQRVSQKTLNEGSQSTTLFPHARRSIKYKWLRLYCIWQPNWQDDMPSQQDKILQGMRECFIFFLLLINPMKTMNPVYPKPDKMFYISLNTCSINPMFTYSLFSSDFQDSNMSGVVFSPEKQPAQSELCSWD